MSNEYCIGPPWTSTDSHNASILFVKTSCPSSRHLGMFSFSFFSPPHEDDHRQSSNFLPPRSPAACHSVRACRQNLHNDGIHDALSGTQAFRNGTDRRDQRCLFGFQIVLAEELGKWMAFEILCPASYRCLTASVLQSKWARRFSPIYTATARRSREPESG